MSKLTIGAYGIFSYMVHRQRQNSVLSQNLININNGEIIEPKKEININEYTEFKTEDEKSIVGIVTPGNYQFIGIGKSNNKCLIKTENTELLVYSKGEYDVRVIAPNVKKIRINSENLILKICYWNYPVSKIREIITDYFKNDKIKEIINLTDNLDENWNDILSISLNNSITNNDFSNPKIQIISKSVNKDISEISNRYNFRIILDSFLKSKNEIIDDPNLISIISQDFKDIDLVNDSILIWIMNYVEIFTTSSGKFFKYFQEANLDENDRKLFINFIIAHKVASLYLNIDSEKELELITLLNNIIESNDNLNKLIKDSIIKYGLVHNNSKNNYYNNYDNYYYYQ